MRSIEEIYDELNDLAASGDWEKIETFLCGCMDKAKEEEAYGIYLAVGNELLCFYRETEQFDRAFGLSEDLLLLMEEFHLEESESFACVMINTAAAYNGAGDFREALHFYRRAVQILERKKESQGLLARILTEMALTMPKTGEETEAEGLLKRAVGLFENRPEDDGDVLGRAEADIYYVTALSGLGEAAWKREEKERALAFYEKAARVSGRIGENAGTKVLWENCAVLARMLGDEEKEQRYRDASAVCPPSGTLT